MESTAGSHSGLNAQDFWLQTALLHPEPSILVQKCRPYAGNLNSETPVDLDMFLY